MRISLAILEKPRFSIDPCNGCGLCCMMSQCPTAEYFLGESKGPCTALEHDGARYWCGLVKNPSKYLGIKLPEADNMLWRSFEFLIGAGQGCSCPDDNDVLKFRNDFNDVLTRKDG